jgi:uncharacterized membrane protein
MNGAIQLVHQAAQALFDFRLWAALIQFAGGLVIVGHVARALVVLVRRGDARSARVLVADGVIWALSFTLAGTLITTALLHTWQQIAIFGAIFVFRFLLKRLFAWERLHVGGVAPER